MYRKAYKKMLEWKEDKTRKPLLLLGARQVGKTWLIVICERYGPQSCEGGAA